MVEQPIFPCLCRAAIRLDGMGVLVFTGDLVIGGCGLGADTLEKGERVKCEDTRRCGEKNRQVCGMKKVTYHAIDGI